MSTSSQPNAGILFEKPQTQTSNELIDFGKNINNQLTQFNDIVQAQKGWNHEILHQLVEVRDRQTQLESQAKYAQRVSLISLLLMVVVLVVMVVGRRKDKKPQLLNG